MKKLLFRIVSVALCSVMLLGLAPIFPQSEVSAATDCVTQGSRDAVVFLAAASPASKVNDFRGLFNRLKGCKVKDAVGTYGMNSAGEVVINGTEFDRIIMVITKDVSLGTGSFAFDYGENTLVGSENIVFTSKCLVTNEAAAWVFTGTAASTIKKYSEYTGTALVDANGLADSYTGGDVELSFSSGETAFHRIACNLTFDYIRLNFPAVNPMIYCYGYDLTVTENTSFTFGGTGVGYRPLVTNGHYKSSETNGVTTYSDIWFSPYLEQNITLLNGEYQYVVPRTRASIKDSEGNVVARDVVGKTINLTFGDIKIVGGASDMPARSAIFANDNYVDSVINIEIDGATFENEYWILGGSDMLLTNDPYVKNCTVNIHIKDADFKKGIFASGVLSGGDRKMYAPDDLEVNLVVEGGSFGFGITAESASDADNILSSVAYCDGVDASAFNGFDVAKLCNSHNLTHTVIGNQIGYGCDDCGILAMRPDMEDGVPVVYAKRHGATINVGRDTFTGMSLGNPVNNISTATEILAAWGKGGIVKPLGGLAIIHGNNMVLADCGGTLVIDGGLGEDGYTSVTVNDAMIVECDLVLKNIKFSDTAAHKFIYLNYNDFTAVENCGLVNEEQSDISIVAGAKNMSSLISSYATNVKDIDQVIKIDGLYVNTISAGSKSQARGSFTPAGSSTKLYRHQFSQDYSVGCTGLTTIIIGKTARVDAISLINKNYTSGEGVQVSPDVKLVIDKDAMVLDNGKLTYVEHTGGTTAADRLYDIASEVFNDGNGLVIIDESFENSEEKIAIVDNDKFGEGIVGKRPAGDDYTYGVRVSYTTPTDFAGWVDSAKVSEFGVLLASADNADHFAYVAENNVAANRGVAKSVALDATQRNYLYEGGETAVTFRGVLVFDGAEEGDEVLDRTFAARAYAVVDATDTVGGKYTVVSDITEFSYSEAE